MISTEATDRRLNRSLSAAKRSHYLKTVLKPFSPLHHSIDRKKNHFVAIESDDWGFSGEVRDHESIERLAGKGYEFEQYLDSGALFNTLESKQDLDELFAILSSHKDTLGRYPAFTANYIVTNPDFEQILQSGFSKYYAIPINTGFPDFHKPRGMSQQASKY